MKRSALMVTIVPLLAIAYLAYEFAHPPWTSMRVTHGIHSRIRNPS